MSTTTAGSAPSLLERVGMRPFDDLAALAAQLCGAPAAAFHLIDIEPTPVTIATPAQASFAAPLRAAAVAALGAANGLAHAGADAAGITTCAVAVETPAGERLGALAVAFAGPRQIADADVRGLRRLARQAGALVEQARFSGERTLHHASRGTEASFDVEEERKASLTAAIHALPDPVAIADRNGVLRYLNPAGRSLLPERDEAEQTLRDLHAPDQRLAFDMAAVQASRRGVWTGETTLVGSGGVRVAVIETLVALAGRPGEPDGLAMVARDVSEFTRQQANLRQSEGRFRHLVEDMDDVLFEQDPDGRWTFLNPSWSDVTGFSVQESLGRHYLDFMHPDDAAASKARRAGLLKDGMHDGVHAARYATKDGSWRWLEARVRRNIGAGGEPVGTVGTLRDVTVRKEMAEELAKARDQALRSTALMSEFLATMSHEIRTPLNGVLGLMTILQDTPLNEEQRGIASSAQRSAEALLTLVNDILDISKLEADKLTIDLVAIDLHTWAREVTGAVVRPRAHEGPRGPALRRPDAARADHRRPDAVPAGPGEPARQRGEVHRPRPRHGGVDGNDRRRRPVDAAHGGGRLRDRHPAGEAGAGVRKVPPGRQLDDAPLWRHRAGTGHLPPAGDAHGRHGGRGERGRKRLDVLVHDPAGGGRRRRGGAIGADRRRGCSDFVRRAGA